MKINLKALHILDNLSEKNFSIILLIKNLKDYTKKNFNSEFKILVNKRKKNFFFKDRDIYSLKNKFVINKICFISKKIKSNDIIHIHGLWNLINILSIIISIIYKKKLVIHPHGMLLEQALNNSIILKKTIKKVILFFLKFIFNKNCFFIAITIAEKESIYQIFDRVKIIEIANATEIRNINKNIKLEKNFVYFGRINKIKNIDLILESFLRSNLDDSFKLFLYVINDDENLKKELKLKIKNSKKIIFKNAVYGAKKDRILKKSWVNVLLSKSEVMSYSVLEAASLGLPSIVTKNISLKNFEKNGGIVARELVEDIVNKFRIISQWTIKERLRRGLKIRRFINNQFSKEIVFKKYEYFYGKII